MGTRNRILIWLSGVALFAVLLGAFGLLLQEQYIGRRRLPDGSVVTLASVTYGNEHRYVEGPLWRRLWASLLPPRAGPQGPLYTVERSEPALAAWVRYAAPPGPRSWGMFAADEHGCRFNASEFGPHFGSKPGATYGSCYVFDAFPRRGRTLDLVFRYARPVGGPRVWRDGPQMHAAFPVANPAAGVYPVWTPRPYPVRRHSGSVTFTLLGLRPERGQEGSLNDRTARFRFLENGRPTENWQAVSIETTDATGNRVGTYLMGGPPFNEAMLWGLCDRESAWKLQVLFARPFPLRAKPEFTWRIRNLAVPSPGGSTHPGSRITRSGVTLRLSGFFGKERPECASLKAPAVRIAVSGKGGPYQVTLLEVTDGSGRRYPPGTGDWLHWSDGEPSQVCWSETGDSIFPVPIPSHLKRVNLTFAVHRTHTVEFLAKP